MPTVPTSVRSFVLPSVSPHKHHVHPPLSPMCPLQSAPLSVASYAFSVRAYSEHSVSLIHSSPTIAPLLNLLQRATSPAPLLPSPRERPRLESISATSSTAWALTTWALW